ncbi:MAG: lysine biosynthesis protein LysX [Candidatus Caldarchaeum sp.]|uniref:Lysine biosynthesis protein LysX n=1 Tax=Caldiarchaeum subterraneum TaxID=311458 RepID=A0A7C5U6P9_CALS0
MNIGLAYDVVRFEEKSLIQAINDAGHVAKPLHVVGKEFWINEGNGHEHDFVIQRCVSYSRALATTTILERFGNLVVNGLDVLRNTADKLITSCMLARRGVPAPMTAVALTRQTAVEIAKKMGFPVVVKPIYGSWGRNIARAFDEQSLVDILELRENMPNPMMKVHYLQEYVDKPERDIRAFYVWGEVPVAIYRVSKMWKTNTALGGRAQPCPVTDELREIVVKAGDAVGGGVLGVDILESKEKGLLVNEVNGVVEFRNTVLVTGYNLAAKIVESTVQVVRR